MATLMLGAIALFTVAAAQVDDIPSLAEQAGVQEIDLRGAVNTTKLPPLTYLRMTGELPAPAPSQNAASVSYGVWDRLAQCESGGNWRINTGNGFYGGLQFLPSTWRANGGVGMPHQATREQQIAVAERLRARSGFAPWPACSRRLGLR